jgi:hypothetical protein
MKHAISLINLVILIVSGCADTGGPRPPKQSWSVPQSDVNDMADCESKYPNVIGTWDPLSGYFLYDGEDAENVRRCLVKKHGWFEFGPPEFAEGTMAPPN